MTLFEVVWAKPTLGFAACDRPGWYVTGWKLNGLRFSDTLSEGASVSVCMLAALVGVYGKVALAGV